MKPLKYVPLFLLFLLSAGLGSVTIWHLDGGVQPRVWAEDAGERGQRWVARVADPERPSILIFVLESTRADHIGPCYGYHRETAPNICELAEDGALFESAYAQGSETQISTPPLFTGRFPRIEGWDSRLIGDIQESTTFPEILEEYGYRTITLQNPDWELRRMSPNLTWTNRSPTHLPTSFGRQPTMALWFNRNKAHAPYLPFSEHNLWVENRTVRDKVKQLRQLNRERGGVAWEAWLAWSDRQPTNTLKNLYDGEIRGADAEIGSIIRSLKADGEYERSLIIVTADHGEAFGEHNITAGHGGKPYRETIHVPLIVKLPEHSFAGTRVRQIVRHVDIGSTILDIVNAPLLDSSLGQSIVPLLQGKSFTLSAFAVGDEWAVLRTARYSYFLSFPLCQENPRHQQLYDLTSDPQEHHDIADRRPDRTTRFHNELCSLSQEDVRLEKHVMDDSTRKRLKQLGYLQND